MNQKAKKDYIKKFMRWLLFAMTIIRHFKKIKPELEEGWRNVKVSARYIIMRVVVITTETVTASNTAVLIGPYDKRLSIIVTNDEKISYAATLLFNKFLFEDLTHAVLKKRMADYFPSAGGAK